MCPSDFDFNDCQNLTGQIMCYWTEEQVDNLEWDIKTENETKNLPHGPKVDIDDNTRYYLNIRLDTSKQPIFNSFFWLSVLIWLDAKLTFVPGFCLLTGAPHQTVFRTWRWCEVPSTRTRPQVADCFYKHISQETFRIQSLWLWGMRLVISTFQLGSSIVTPRLWAHSETGKFKWDDIRKTCR